MLAAPPVLPLAASFPAVPAPDPDVAAVRGWAAELGALAARIDRHFRRAEPRRWALAYLQGLLGPLERKNGWHLAEAAGATTPYGVQHLLGRAVWDAEAVRDEVRAYVVERLGAAAAVLVVDETGFLKKGERSVGVQRQYSGTAGRIENCQVGVLLAYATPQGHAFLDRALYLPKSWTDDPPRCRAAGVPADVEFGTKPRLAQAMPARAIAAEVPFGWVTGDEVYGGDRRLRIWLEAQDRPHVLAIKTTEPLWTMTETGPAQVAAAAVVAALPADAWVRLGAGAGAKGPRRYGWARAPIRPLKAPGKGYWVLARRSLADPDDRAYYGCYGPAATGLAELVRVAGMRWAIEEGIEAAKGEVGLDHYEVRHWAGWHRHVTLCLLAHAFLAATRAEANGGAGTDPPAGPPPSRGSLAAFRARRGLGSG